jgi:hypothetical protein
MARELHNVCTLALKGVRNKAFCDGELTRPVWFHIDREGRVRVYARTREILEQWRDICATRAVRQQVDLVNQDAVRRFPFLVFTPAAPQPA